MTSKTLAHLALTLGLSTTGTLFAAQTAQAQVSANSLNVNCVWEPNVGDYAVMVYHQPSHTLVHSLPAGDIKAQQMCTNVPGDLTNWIWNDLLTNGTAVATWGPGGLGGANDQFDTAIDVFCPDPIIGPPVFINPRVIGSILESTAPPYKWVSEPQTSAVVNYECPRAAVVNPPVPVPTATYDAFTCDDGFITASATFFDTNALSLTETGNLWQASASSLASQPVTVPQGLTHCDPAVASVAESYLQDNVGLLNPHDFGVDIWDCPQDNLVVTVDSCDVQGNVSTYGYQISCCEPEPDPMIWGFTSHSTCLTPSPWGTGFFLYGTMPNTPYTDPNTVCADLQADYPPWMDSLAPLGGNQVCSPSWGAAAGGNYVPGTASINQCQVVALRDPSCAGFPRIHFQTEFACTP
jgi:hypothetical protein